MNLTIVPFGNARKRDGKFECQHGDGECQGNRWEQCAIAHYPNITEHFAFIDCLEKERGDPAKAQLCANQTSLDFSTLNKCYSGPESVALQEAAYHATPSDHQYVPWIVLNGTNHCQECEFGFDGFHKAVCDAYQGTDKPRSCSPDAANIKQSRTPSVERCPKEPSHLMLTLLPEFSK